MCDAEHHTISFMDTTSEWLLLTEILANSVPLRRPLSSFETQCIATWRINSQIQRVDAGPCVMNVICTTIIMQANSFACPGVSIPTNSQDAGVVSYSLNIIRFTNLCGSRHEQYIKFIKRIVWRKQKRNFSLQFLIPWSSSSLKISSLHCTSIPVLKTKHFGISTT
jgi:hypothetical protein